MQTVDGNGNPLISFKDAFTIRNINNGKLAELYLANKIEENKMAAVAEKERLAAENAKFQQESNDQAANKAIQLQKDKLKYDERIKELEGRNKKEEILLDKGLEIWKTLLTPQKAGGEGSAMTIMPKQELPTELAQLLNLTFQSVAQSLTVEINKSDQQIQEEQAEQQALMQAAAEQQMMQQQQTQPM